MYIFKYKDNIHGW